MESADVEKAWRCVLQHDVGASLLLRSRLVVTNAAPLRQRSGGRHATLAVRVPAPLPVVLVDGVADASLVARSAQIWQGEEVVLHLLAPHLPRPP